MLTIGVELGADRSDGSVWVKGVDADGPWARAGGAAGDLCTTIDGEPAAQVVAQWQEGLRLRTAGEQITVELERHGEKLTIMPRWEEFAASDPSDANPGDADESADPDELTEDEERELGLELERASKTAKATVFSGNPIDPRLDPRPPVGPAPANQQHLRVHGGPKQPIDKRIKDVVDWQNEMKKARHTGTAVDENYDPLSFETLDRDRDQPSDWWNEPDL
jgi:hypothetical protein